jgi:hypothetical protein
MFMLSFDLHPTLLILLVAASGVSLLLLILKGLGKEVESTGTIWIRAVKKLRLEWKKPVELPSRQQKLEDHNQSNPVRIRKLP